MSEIILYFSRAGENYVSGAIRKLEKGNTQLAAEMIQSLTGAELFQIEPLVSYSKDYSECIDQAKKDQRREARPELKAYPEALEAYDTIYLGYPNYWGTMPMPVFTLLERYDLSEKTIRPFCTHEGSGAGDSLKDLEKECPGAHIGRVLEIQGGRVEASRKKIEEWVRSQA